MSRSCAARGAPFSPSLRLNMAHVRQSRPDSGFGCRVKVLQRMPQTPRRCGRALPHGLFILILLLLLLLRVRIASVLLAAPSKEVQERGSGERFRREVHPGRGGGGAPAEELEDLIHVLVLPGESRARQPNLV